MKVLFRIVFFLLLSVSLYAENGHQLRLRNTESNPVNVVCTKDSPILSIAKNELKQGWQGESNASFVLTIKTDKAIVGDGFKIVSNGIQANTEKGILYGVYELLRRQQTNEEIKEELCNPSYQLRILNHWDNLDGSIERGYAGLSIFWRKGNDAMLVTENNKLWAKHIGRSIYIVEYRTVNANRSICTGIFFP